MAHWGSSEVTGRGLLALVGSGQLYSVELKAGEQYIVHPRYARSEPFLSLNLLMLKSNVVAYSMNPNPPRPYRFKSTTLKFQVPGLKSLPGFLQNTQFIKTMSETDSWKTAMRIFHKLRTWSRMTIWGDRLFLQFDGPSTILLQSRGARLNEILTPTEVNELASAPRGLTIIPSDPEGGKQQPSETDPRSVPGSRSVEEIEQEVQGVTQRVAVLTKEGKVMFEKPEQQ